MMNVEEKEENARTRTNELEIISALLSRFVPWRWKPALLWARHSHTALQQSALIYDQRGRQQRGRGWLQLYVVLQV